MEILEVEIGGYEKFSVSRVGKEKFGVQLKEVWGYFPRSVFHHSKGILESDSVDWPEDIDYINKIKRK